MEIRNLMTFVQVAELNSFTRAAKVLGYTQSTVSFQIQQLEKELGAPLFDRINHTITLTEKGRDLLQYAHRIMQLTEEFHQQSAASQQVSGHVRIVTADSICQMMLSNNYQNFYSRYPDITLKFYTADTEEMFHMLDQNEADVMFTLDKHIYRANYLIAKEEPVDVHFMAGKDHPLAHQAAVHLEDIMAYPLVLTEKGMGYRHLLDEEMARRSMDVSPALEVGRTDLIVELLARGTGVSFLPDFAARTAIESGQVKPLEVVNFTGQIWKQLIYHKNKWISAPLKEFLTYVMDHEFSS